MNNDKELLAFFKMTNNIEILNFFKRDKQDIVDGFIRHKTYTKQSDQAFAKELLLTKTQYNQLLTHPNSFSYEQLWVCHQAINATNFMKETLTHMPDVFITHVNLYSEMFDDIQQGLRDIGLMLHSQLSDVAKMGELGDLKYKYLSFMYGETTYQNDFGEELPILVSDYSEAYQTVQELLMTLKQD